MTGLVAGGREEVNSGGISTGQAFLIAFLALTPETRGVRFRLSTHPSSHPGLLWVSSPLFWTALLRERGRER